ncbi:hypothetical protein IG631_24305 [Alternaria alternata]|nr:hypothetical protein IG631_24305 [Alternaria alternata]
MLAATFRVVAIGGFLPTLLAAIHGSGHASAFLPAQSTLHTVCSSPTHAPVTLAPLPSMSAVSSTVYHDQPIASGSVKGRRPISTVTTTLTSTHTIPTLTDRPAIASMGYMEIVNKWRAKLDMKALVHDPELETNAMDAVVAGNGAETHKLNPGTFGQVIAPGKLDTFEHVFVGGWLCEIPDLPGLGDACASQSVGWIHNGETDHAKILTSEDYTRIGCALYAGVWCCDLA